MSKHICYKTGQRKTFTFDGSQTRNVHQVKRLKRCNIRTKHLSPVSKLVFFVSVNIINTNIFICENWLIHYCHNIHDAPEKRNLHGYATLCSFKNGRVHLFMDQLGRKFLPLPRTMIWQLRRDGNFCLWFYFCFYDFFYETWRSKFSRHVLIYDFVYSSGITLFEHILDFFLTIIKQYVIAFLRWIYINEWLYDLWLSSAVRQLTVKDFEQKSELFITTIVDSDTTL